MLILPLSHTTDIFALSMADYPSNDVLWYNPLATDCPVASRGGTISVSVNGDLPAETLQKLEAAGVQSKVEQNMERYVAAQTATGIPWQVMASVHYREAGLDPSKSLAAGETRRDGKSIDGIQMYADANKDAISAATHFISNAQSMYGIDLSTDSSLDSIANGFLAYNRGYMYKNWDKTWQESPYVANGIDESHMNMQWIDADSYVRPGGRKLNNISGTTDTNVGALAVYKYLGGPLNGSGAISPNPNLNSTADSLSNCGLSGGANGDATIVGDMAFPLVGSKKTATSSPGMFRNNTTDTGGHPYTSYDIMAEADTPLVAFMGGTVNHIGRDRCGGRLISIFNSESNLTISYLHMNDNLSVARGQEVKAGDSVGRVGSDVQGCGSPGSGNAHLHIDAARGSVRPGCSRLNCPTENSSKFQDIGPQLYTLFQALPES